MNYTLASGAGIAIAAGVDVLLLRTMLLRRKAFWVSYVIVLFFQLIVNGLLTGLKIVRYDRARITGLHLVFAPVEDIGFGFAMVLITLSLWVYLGSRSGGQRDKPASPPPPGAGG